MILTNLPSPGVHLSSQQLRTVCWKSICSVELAAQSGAGGKTSRADELRDFFVAAAQAANAVAVTTKTITSV
jgi:hypothetical protein